MRVILASLQGLALVTLLATTPAQAQGEGAGAHEAGKRGEPIAAGLTPQQRAEKRMPQPVRVGDLAGRLVIEPSQHQGSLGRVAAVARQGGALKLVLRTTGILGIGARTVAVPIEAVALLGQFVQVADLPLAEFNTLPDWTGAGATTLAPDDVVRIGLNRN